MYIESKDSIVLIEIFNKNEKEFGYYRLKKKKKK